MTDQKLEIDGVVVQGLRAAGAVTLPRQKDHFEIVIPEMRGCHWATINLRLQLPLFIETPDHETEFNWGGSRPEKFGFLKIQIEFPVGGALSTGWVYIPHDSPHFGEPFLVEVITEKIEGLTYGSTCRIHLLRGRVEGDWIVV
jgi:hypothetical protein